MTWELTHCLVKHKLKIFDALNLLQEYGVISDNSVTPEDVGEADSAAAVKWLDTHPFQVEEKLNQRKELDELQSSLPPV